MKKKISFWLKELLLCLVVVVLVHIGCHLLGFHDVPTVENKSELTVGADYDGVAMDFSADVEHIVALHRQTVYAKYGGDYSWYEVQVYLNDIITAENIDDLHVTDVTTVFQRFSPDLCITVTSNAAKGTLVTVPTPGLWIEDMDLTDDNVKLTFADALSRLKEYNGVWPQGATKFYLRKPLGPVRCNPQWITGGVYDPLFIDAVTGEVSDWNPAFRRK